MVQRLTYRGRNTHNSPSNKQDIVKTPGNRLVYQRRKKMGRPASCADCKHPLHGVSGHRPAVMHRLPKHRKTVSRAYGGNRCPTCVRKRILRAFLYDEKRCVAAVLLEKKRQKRAETASKSASKTKKKVAKKH
eukprot:Blabericola_migrator_1__10803@NODE_6209_length_578_cov_336_637965_g4180_i0_p1_GENE_NODE_6209_length_578_cov_336_637965_g4180_i0NODE_6209_length_578_cov_336_637965_g4180_i0_p1_ORF_typecomplete_len133_score25_01Ribosomal_L34e/PF01199_18/2_6e35Ribosomal_L34e/PF01199_18/6_7e02_NODE_6209_length_578_cov_336_637965_g4180_i0118516